MGKVRDRLAHQDAQLAALEEALARWQGEGKEELGEMLSSLQATREHLADLLGEIAGATAEDWTDVRIRLESGLGQLEQGCADLVSRLRPS